MKKSFMTRVLATGLSLAMAFSLSAATNVSVASAAAKPAMKSKTMTVKVGQKKNYQATAATQKAYKITKVKMSAAGKTKAKVTVNSSKKSIKVEGLAATKGSNVVISFKNNKTKKTTTVTTKVVVKDEKLTMTAAATKVKQITVTFNKAVDTTTTKLVVKKGSATPTVASTTFAADAKSAQIAMGTKLTEGTYTVEATVGEKVLTAEVKVENEKLTTFVLVGNNLVASATSTTKASISYKALNQYDEMMPATAVEPTCSFGDIVAGETKMPTADKAGVVVVDGINSALAIPGQTGTLVLVDTSTGVNLNATITYQSKAVASSATVYGVYDSKTEKLVEGDLKAGDKVTNYSLLVNVKDQYDNDMTPDAITKSGVKVSLNPASVLTNLTVDSDAEIDGDESELSYDGKNCFLVKLYAGASDSAVIDKAGTLGLTIVSAYKGVLATPTITVSSKVVVASMNISPKDTVYANAENELIVDAVDTNGNAITKYDDLKTITCSAVVLKKNADGTGKFVYKPASITPTKQQGYKDSTVASLVFYANDTTSGNYIVKPITLKVFADQKPWKVAGIKSDVTTAVASGKALTIDVSKLIYEDQYSNNKKYDATSMRTNVSLYMKNADGIFTAAGVVTSGALTVGGDGKVVVTAGAVKGSATIFAKYKNMDEPAVNADEDHYDFKFDISVADSAVVTASDLTLKINDGHAIYGAGEITVNPSETNSTLAVSTGAGVVSAVVTGKLGGKTIVIPASQFVVTSGKLGNYGKIDASKNVAEKTETKTVTVVVDTENGPQTVSTEVTVSNADQKATEIKVKDNDGNKFTATSTTLNATELIKAVKILDQYGNDIASAKKGEVVYKVTFTGTSAAAQDLLVHNESQSVTATLAAGTTYYATVEYTFGGLTFAQDVEITTP